MAETVVSYCGAPPIPGETSWILDPILLTCLAALFGAYWIRSRSKISRTRRLCFAAGWVLTVLALVSPLCSLGAALFSARVAQHMVLALVAAPLIALGRPDRILLPAAIGRLAEARPAAWGAALVYALALWSWHMPGPYALSFRSDWAYWLMHLSMFLPAVLLASKLIEGIGELGGAFLAGIASMLQMSLLGALLTLAPRAWYEVHAFTTAAWGFLPMEDQQLGGLIMWVIAGLLSMLYALVGIGLWLGRLNERPA